MVTKAQQEAQKAAGDVVQDADVIEETPRPAPPQEPQKAQVPETLEEKRNRLKAELATVEEEGVRQGGFKEVPKHIGVLLCGCYVGLANTNATTHHCDEHDITVQFVNTYPISDEVREKLGARVGNL